MTHVLLEVCTDSLKGIEAARAGGADGVELCAGLVEGGTTPSHGLLEAAREATDLELVVLARPRAGDFLYEPGELEVLVRDVAWARTAGADRIAVGVLTPEGRVDAQAMGRLLDAADPLPVTFHRAFDAVREPFEALEDLVELGVDRVLSSGMASEASAGASTLARLVEAAGEELLIVAAGGVRPSNVRQLVEATGVRAVHTSARGSATSPMRHRNELVSVGAAELPGEFERRFTDEATVAQIASGLRSMDGS